MDYNTFDNDTNPSDDDYSDYIEWLSELTAENLRHAKGDHERQKQELCRYYKRGERANLTVGELIDFLGVSSPSILDMADYTEEEGVALFVVSDALTEEEISRVSLPDVAQPPEPPSE